MEPCCFRAFKDCRSDLTCKGVSHYQAETNFFTSELIEYIKERVAVFRLAVRKKTGLLEKRLRFKEKKSLAL